PGRLPLRFRSSVPWDGTLPLLELQQRLARAPGSPEREEASSLLSATSTSCSGSLGSLPDSRTTAHFWIQYKAGTISGDLTIDSYASSLEAVWSKEITSFGWRAPPLVGTPAGAKYHVAVKSLSGGLYGFVSASGTYAGLIGNNPHTSWDDKDSFASCMVLNSNYAGFPSPPQASLDSTTAHEFVHSIQFGLGALHRPDGADAGNAPDSVVTDRAFTEGIATWMEDEVFDPSNDNYNYLWPQFAPRADTSDQVSMGQYSLSPYPYWIAWRGITERYGTGLAGGGEDVMQSFWEKVSQDDNWNVLTAMQAAVSTKGATLADAFHAYAIAVRFNRSCTGGYIYPHCFEEGPGYVAAGGAVPAHGSIETVGASFSGSVQDNYALAWVRLPTSGGPYSVRLSNTSSGGELRGSVVCDTGSSLDVSPLPTTILPGALSTLVGFDPAGCSGSVLVITNQSQTSPNPGSSAARSYTVTTIGPHELQVTILPSGSGTVTSQPPGISCPPTCSAGFADGAVVRLTDHPDPEFDFGEWGGACAGATCQVEMEAPQAVTATFAPDVTPPGQATTRVSPLPFTLSRSLRGSWSATDGVRFEVQRRSAVFNAGFSGFGSWLTTSATSAWMTGTPGRTYCLRTLARDGAGNPSSSYGTEACSAIPLDDRSLARRGSWRGRTNGGAYLGTYLQSRRQGSRLLLDGVRAKRIAIIVGKCPGCGTIKVFLGSQLLRKISLRSSTRRWKQLIHVASFPSVRTGRLRIKVTSADGKRVRVEGVGISAV
ncbi:MAG TPA: hypothetical protein VEA19_04215, partial [Actinomycetota bacterium]|nr:hypothetical protein [Actinomycetota bacterium]